MTIAKKSSDADNDGNGLYGLKRKQMKLHKKSSLCD